MSSSRRAKICAAGHVLGGIEVPTEELLREAGYQSMGFDLNLITENMGISHVRHCAEITKPGELAARSGEIALRKSGVSASDIDMVLFCGIERDLAEPATAHRIAHELGINAKYCFDVSSACHGFTDGLLVAQAYIASGRAEHVLVTTGECSSSKAKLILDYFNKGKLDKSHAIDALGAFALGDAGGAMVLTHADPDNGVMADRTANRSDLRRLCFWDNFGVEHGVDPSFGMKMAQICARTIGMVQAMMPSTLQDLNWDKADIDLFIPHQVGKRPFDIYLEMFGLTIEQSLATYPRCGNLTSATIPVCWDILESAGRIPKGSKIFIVSTGSGIVVSQLGIIA
ncbi:MAG: 3-oxoacyl-[acyl-carrier-protein] synthase III C-terminal domain-containing protein [Gammaproteobacteria bacterium]